LPPKSTRPSVTVVSVSTEHEVRSAASCDLRICLYAAVTSSFMHDQCLRGMPDVFTACNSPWIIEPIEGNVTVPHVVSAINLDSSVLRTCFEGWLDLSIHNRPMPSCFGAHDKQF